MNLVFQGTIDTANGTRIDCINTNMEVSLMIFNNIQNAHPLYLKVYTLKPKNTKTC